MPNKRSNTPGSAPAPAAGSPSSPPDASDALWSALDANPDDRVVLLALADWLEEHGDADASACLRWAHAEGKAPFQYLPTCEISYHYDGWKPRWYWWAREEDVVRWQIPPSCGLLDRLWKRLAHTFDYSPATFKEYPGVRAAFEALIAGWRQVPRRWKPDRAPRGK